MTHSEYKIHLKKWLEFYEDDPDFQQTLSVYQREFIIICELNLDRAIPILQKLYCPIPYKKPKEPVCMVRAFLLMTLIKESRIDKWVSRTRTTPLLPFYQDFRQPRKKTLREWEPITALWIV